MRGTRIGFGMFAGVVGCTAFVLVMGMMEILPPVGELVGGPPVVTLILDMITGILLGGAFGGVLGPWAGDPLRGVGSGLLYGLGWWVVGPLLLVPWWLGSDAAASGGPLVGAALPSLLGFLAFGAALGGTYGWLRRSVPGTGRDA